MADTWLRPVVVASVVIVRKPLLCLLQFHQWRLIVNDEGQRYKQCDRCGGYRDFDPRPTM